MPGPPSGLLQRFAGLAGFGAAVYGVNALVMAGTDARLGAPYRPQVNGVVQLPVIDFSVETVGALVDVLKASSPLIVTLAIVAAGIICVMSIASVRNAVLVRVVPGGLGEGSPLKRASRHIDALMLVALIAIALTALTLELPARAIQNQLLGDQVTSLLRNNELSGRLAREQYCDAIANNPKVLRQLGITCAGNQWRVLTGKASTKLTRWHAELVVLVLLSLLVVVFAFQAADESVVKSGARRITLAVAGFLTVLAVAGLPYAYGAVFRSVNPLQVRIFRTTPTYCMGYLLSREGTTVTIYNAGAGIVETLFGVTRISTMPPSERNDLLEAKLSSSLRSVEETSSQECE